MLARRLETSAVPCAALASLFNAVYRDCPVIVEAAVHDFDAIIERDPSTKDPLYALLFHKGFLALQCHRLAHHLWMQKRRGLAAFLQNRGSEVFAVDIHPAAVIGKGAFIDHATGVVIGETSQVGDNVSMFQGVTLGGTGKASGDRHPKIRDDVLLCAGATILGNIVVGQGAKIGAGSVVLESVEANATVVGVPAREVGRTSGVDVETVEHPRPLAAAWGFPAIQQDDQESRARQGPVKQ
jgi:serine O-acetyltransferase